MRRLLFSSSRLALPRNPVLIPPASPRHLLSSLLFLTLFPSLFPSSARGPEVAIPAGAWPCSAQSLCTGEQQTHSSTGSRSCRARLRGGNLGRGGGLCEAQASGSRMLGSADEQLEEQQAPQ